MADTLPSLEDYRSRARAWLAANLQPRDPDAPVRFRGVDETPEHMAKQRQLQQVLFDGGYAGITVPAAYGGQGLSAAHEAVFLDEVAGYVTPALGVVGGVTMHIVLPTILATCSEAFKHAHVPEILSGRELWCQFLSEPGAGSDLAGIRTRAARDGDTWVINGAKIWSSGAMFADYGLCLTRTNWDVPKHQGVTWFAMPTKAKGVTVQPIREINGGEEFCEEFFDDVVLTDDHVMGEVNRGWTLTQTMLVFERGGGRTAEPLDTDQAEVVAPPVAPDLVASARARGTLADAHVRQLIARVATDDFMREQLKKRVEVLLRMGTRDAGKAAYMKLAAGTFDPIRADIAMQVAGATAICWTPGDLSGALVSTNFLNGRIQSIAGGTNEMQRNGIGERVLGLPKEPSFDQSKPFKDVLSAAANWTGKF